MATQVAVLSLFSYTTARIKTNGLWTDNDWYDDALKVGVRNGVPYSKDDAELRRLDAPMATEGEVLDYMEFSNV
jgi:hypothetical protein